MTTDHKAQVDAAREAFKRLFDEYRNSPPKKRAVEIVFEHGLALHRLAALASASPAPVASEPVEYQWRFSESEFWHPCSKDWHLKIMAGGIADAETRALYDQPQPPAASSDALDASRYRWLRAERRGKDRLVVVSSEFACQSPITGEGLDDALDAALKGKQT